MNHPLGRDRFRFPILPEKIKVKTGATFQSYTVMGKGEIKLPSGRQLTGFSWDAFLPGESRKDDPYVKGNYRRNGQYIPGAKWRNPKEIQGMWSQYQAWGTKLRLLVTETPINHDVYIESYSVDYSGGYGDYFYSINFIYAIDLTVRLHGATSEADNAQTQNISRPVQPTPATYTTVTGDTLYKIALKHLGAGGMYTLLHEANRSVIGPDPDIVRPGTVLTIPAA
jgi:LysM repeat protein